jgi:hypothetical protein
VCAKALLVPVIDREFTDDRAKKHFAASGTKTAEELCNELHMSIQTVSQIWQRWELLVLLTKDGRGYRKSIQS